MGGEGHEQPRGRGATPHGSDWHKREHAAGEWHPGGGGTLTGCGAGQRGGGAERPGVGRAAPPASHCAVRPGPGQLMVLS